MQRLLAIFILCAAVIEPAAASNLTVAYPFTSETFERADVRACADNIALAAKAGRSDHERAAFLTLNDDGSFGCTLWPPTFTWRRTSWEGRIPENTIAVMHTHPSDMPQPSQHDFAEARRIGAPVIVVSRRTIMVAMPLAQGR
jgi:hypothetical protein